MIKLNLLVRKLLFVLMLSKLLPGVSCMHKDVKATGKKTEKGKIGTIQVIIIGACLCVVAWFIYDFKYSQKNCPWKNEKRFLSPPSYPGVYKGISTNSNPQPLPGDTNHTTDTELLLDSSSSPTPPSSNAKTGLSLLGLKVWPNLKYRALPNVGPSLSAQRRARVNSASPKNADRDVNLNTDENMNINSLRIDFLPCELQPFS